ncbi:transposon Tf2-1 polyprotein [Tanacetum coccineum]
MPVYEPEPEALINFDPDPPNQTPDPILDLLTPPNHSSQIFTMTLSFDGSSQPSTFRCTAIINGHLLSTLIDSGSSHSFIHPKPNKLKHLSLPQPDNYTFQVHVGSGHTLKTGGTLKSVQFSVQEVDFVTDFHVLPVHGCDMVLGNSWLRSLGPVLTNHSTFSMSFFYQGTLISLTGDQNTLITSVSPTNLKRSLDLDSIIAFTLLSVEIIPKNSITKKCHTLTLS